MMAGQRIYCGASLRTIVQSHSPMAHDPLDHSADRPVASTEVIGHDGGTKDILWSVSAYYTKPQPDGS
jgi:hypothetical protein